MGVRDDFHEILQDPEFEGAYDALQHAWKSGVDIEVSKRNLADVISRWLKDQGTTGRLEERAKGILRAALNDIGISAGRGINE